MLVSKKPKKGSADENADHTPQGTLIHAPRLKGVVKNKGIKEKNKR